MIISIVSAVVISLAIVGLTEFFKLIHMFVLFSKNQAEHLSVIIPDDNDAEFAVRAYAERERWNYFATKTTLIVLTGKLSNESVVICKKLAKEYGGILVLTPEEFKGKI